MWYEARTSRIRSRGANPSVCDHVGDDLLGDAAAESQSILNVRIRTRRSYLEPLRVGSRRNELDPRFVWAVGHAFG